MGNFLTVSISCDQLLSRSLDCSSTRAICISKLEDNVNALQTAVEELADQKNDVKRKVNLAEEQQLKPLDQVKRWISRAEATVTEVNGLLRDGPREIEKLCLGGYCSKNYRSSYKFARKVDKSLKNVADLKSKRDFEEVAERVPAASGIPRPSVPTVGMELIFNKVWTCLGGEQVGIVGLYGMGGVGKTTLLTQINNQYLNTPKDFDTVIWVQVSKDLKLGTVQVNIGKRIGLPDELLNNRSIDEKASVIFNALRQKKFVLLLDDIWARVDLHKLGVPLPNVINNGSKVVFTTRSEEVCGQMEANNIIKVGCMEWDDAWVLFQNKVGQQTLCMHPDIPELARIVAEECGGLPLALITIGRAMACKRTPPEWHHAVEVLKRSASEFSGMGDEVFPLLKFSYDNLSDSRIRTCFLYCCLFPEDFLIKKTELIDYWIGEGILDRFPDRNVYAAECFGYDIIGTLVQACLLEDKDDCVRMHDVIRDMALWIASEVEKEKESFLVLTGAQLAEAPEVGKWEGVRRISLMANSIASLSVTPKCSNLITLFLGNAHLKRISTGFFQFMPNLTVLDLSNNSSLLGLPRNVSRLLSLQYLNLSRTGIKELPAELNALVKLRYLNLDHTPWLLILPHGVISSFRMIQKLRMFRCGSSGQTAEGCILSSDELLVKELQCLEQLNMLTATIRSAAALEKLSGFQMLQNCTRVLYLELSHGETLLNFSSLATMKHLNTLHICHCGNLEELQIDRGGGEIRDCNNLNPVAITDKSFQSLTSVYVEDCLSLRNLTWLVLARNLTFLRVSNCPKLVEVASAEKLGEIPGMKGNINPFEKLEVLELLFLPHLKSFYSHSLQSSLKQIKAIGCPCLDMRPLNTGNAYGNV